MYKGHRTAIDCTRAKYWSETRCHWGWWLIPSVKEQSNKAVKPAEKDVMPTWAATKYLLLSNSPHSLGKKNAEVIAPLFKTSPLLMQPCLLLWCWIKEYQLMLSHRNFPITWTQMYPKHPILTKNPIGLHIFSHIFDRKGLLQWGLRGVKMLTPHFSNILNPNTPSKATKSILTWKSYSIECI